MTLKPSEKLTNGCAQILEKYCKSVHHKISLVETDDYFAMSSREPVKVRDETGEYNAVAFKTNDKLGFNFALKFDITTTGSRRLVYELTDANLRVFSLNDNMSHQLFRAEFAINKHSSNHAQPHWQFQPHLYRTLNSGDWSQIVELKKNELELADETPDESHDINLSKIHFSMSSDWCKPINEQKSNSHVIKLDDQNVVRWLDGCLAYISSQITNTRL